MLGVVDGAVRQPPNVTPTYPPSTYPPWKIPPRFSPHFGLPADEACYFLVCLLGIALDSLPWNAAKAIFLWGVLQEFSRRSLLHDAALLNSRLDMSHMNQSCLVNHFTYE